MKQSTHSKLSLPAIAINGLILSNSPMILYKNSLHIPFYQRNNHPNNSLFTQTQAKKAEKARRILFGNLAHLDLRDGRAGIIENSGKRPRVHSGAGIYKGGRPSLLLAKRRQIVTSARYDLGKWPEPGGPKLRLGWERRRRPEKLDCRLSVAVVNCEGYYTLCSGDNPPGYGNDWSMFLMLVRTG